jgi:hypothetical protein
VITNRFIVLWRIILIGVPEKIDGISNIQPAFQREDPATIVVKVVRTELSKNGGNLTKSLTISIANNP